ncbi:hypothetical protein [Paraburkholderia adhaesiva]|uniref:hypothetical protein n=1 Tax=Paraburkholderia adhaesiva TaxID=2883244 RepID=UPI001F272162|nr:hypothetical protein [Paraburkholderia adhaesiva]
MDLDEAFSAVEHLASRHRLLVGRGKRGEQGEPLEVEWGAGDIRDIPKLRGLEFVSEIGPHLLELYERYMTGKSPVMTSVTLSTSVVTFIVLGAESPDQVAETLRCGADELVSLTVKGYLSERFSDWKKPSAQVLPFQPRNRE